MNSLLVLSILLLLEPGAVVEYDSRSCCGACVDALEPGPALNGVNDIPRLAEVSPILFLGKVIRAELDPCCDGWADVTFRVKQMYKGQVEPLITIRTGGSCARPFPFTLGVEYLVSARYPSGADPHRYLYNKFAPLEAGQAWFHIRALDDWSRANIAKEGPK